MPRSLQHLTCCVALAAAIQAGAPTAGTAATPVPGSASEEMLRLWELRDAIAAAPQSEPAFDTAGEPGVAAFDAPSRTWQLESPAPDAMSRPVGTTPGTPSMTPNIDRLLQRSYRPLVASDAPHVSSTATRAYRSGRTYSKSGSSSVSGKKDDHRPTPPGRDDRHGHHGGGDHEPSTPTPEPATMLLFGGAAAAAAGLRKRARRA